MSLRQNQGNPAKRPPGYTSIRDVLDGKYQQGSFVNVMGLVVDCQAPTPTKGSDWKCALRLSDQSVGDSYGDSIACHIFLKQGEIPDPAHGDILVFYQIKVQFRDGISLLTNFATKFGHFKADKIPHPPGDASSALTTGPSKRAKKFDKAELGWVALLYHGVDKTCLPTKEEYETRVVQSRNTREKFSELKDVENGNFYDIIVRLVKEPYDLGDKLSFWVTDYTENPAFFNFSIKATSLEGAQDGDPYGYGAKPNKKAPKDQLGGEDVYGRRSMQITCYEPHASAAREAKISKGSWVSIKNLHVKYGHSQTNLEGFLREDRHTHGSSKLRISVLEQHPDKETIDPRYYSAIRRHRDYSRAKAEQLREIGQAASAGQKRKSDVGSEDKAETDNAKSRRRAKRQEAARRAREEQQQATKPEETKADSARDISAPNLNPSVKCENYSVPPSTVSKVLGPVMVEADIDGQSVQLPLPFANLNYRVDVRVTDFRPSNLINFAYPKNTSQFDVLSDNEESDLGSEPERSTADDTTSPVRVWQWRFSLELEDATVDGNGERFWVVIDNQAAQCLTNLDASDLKHDSENLEALRQRMWFLWGDLEEQKASREAEIAQARRASSEGRPPPDSSDDEGGGARPLKVANRPFSCCVRQYGVKVRESDPAKADAGQGHRWVRMFGLYGTRITGV